MNKVLTIAFFFAFGFFGFSLSVLASDKVEINTATIEQLDTLTGIGPAYAQRIVDGRPFSSVDDLIRVKGIGEKTLQKIKEQGLAYVAEEPAIGTPDIPIAPITTPTPAPEPTPAPIEPKQTQEQTAEGGLPLASTGESAGVGHPLTATPDIAIAKIQTPICQKGIIFTEILPSPEGADETDEWIEIFNQNETEISLADYQIRDTQGKISYYSFTKESKILPKQYLVLSRQKTKISLNNDQDGLELLCQENIIDSVFYQSAKKGQSYNKIGKDWLWSSILTPGKENKMPIVKKDNKEIIPEKEIKETDLEASASQAFSNKKGALNIYIIALLTAFFSGGIIFLLKKNLPPSL